MTVHRHTWRAPSYRPANPAYRHARQPAERPARPRPGTHPGPAQPSCTPRRVMRPAADPATRRLDSLTLVDRRSLRRYPHEQEILNAKGLIVTNFPQVNIWAGVPGADRLAVAISSRGYGVQTAAAGRGCRRHQHLGCGRQQRARPSRGVGARRCRHGRARRLPQRCITSHCPGTGSAPRRGGCRPRRTGHRPRDADPRLHGRCHRAGSAGPGRPDPADGQRRPDGPGAGGPAAPRRRNRRGRGVTPRHRTRRRAGRRRL